MPDYGEPIENDLNFKPVMDLFRGKKNKQGRKDVATRETLGGTSKRPDAFRDFPRPKSSQEDMADKMARKIADKQKQNKSIEQASYPYTSIEDSLQKLMKEYPDSGMSDEDWDDIKREYDMGQQEGPRSEGTVQGTPKQLEEEPMSTQRSAGGVKVKGVPEDAVDSPANFPESHKLHGPKLEDLKNSLLKLMKADPTIEKVDARAVARGVMGGLRDKKDNPYTKFSRGIPEGDVDQETGEITDRPYGEQHSLMPFTGRGDDASAQYSQGHRAGKSIRNLPVSVADRVHQEMNPEMLGEAAAKGKEAARRTGKAAREQFQPPETYTSPEVRAPRSESDMKQHLMAVGNRREGKGPMELAVEKALLKLMKEDKPKFRASVRPPEHMGSSEEPITYKPLPDPETGEAAGSPAEANDLPIYEPPRPKGKLKYPGGYSIEDTLLKLMKGGDEQQLNAMDKENLPKENKDSKAIVADGDSKRPKSEVGTNDKMFKKAESRQKEVFNFPSDTPETRIDAPIRPDPTESETHPEQLQREAEAKLNRHTRGGRESGAMGRRLPNYVSDQKFSGGAPERRKTPIGKDDMEKGGSFWGGSRKQNVPQTPPQQEQPWGRKENEASKEAGLGRRISRFRQNPPKGGNLGVDRGQRKKSIENSLVKLMKEGDITAAKVGMPRNTGRDLDKAPNQPSSMGSPPTWKTSEQISSENMPQNDDPSKWSAQHVADIIGQDAMAWANKPRGQAAKDAAAQGQGTGNYDATQPHQTATQNKQKQTQQQGVPPVDGLV